MKRLPLVLFLCLTGAVLYFCFNSPRPASPKIDSTAATSPANPAASPAVSAHPSAVAAASEARAASASSPGPNATPSATTTTAASSTPSVSVPEYTDIPPATVLENMRTAVLSYGHTFGGNPVGTNPEITSALNGDNPKQIKFLQPDAGMRINGNGELVDNWGTPFFFHQLSGSQTEIRSAGPDRKMWTSDDLVIE